MASMNDEATLETSKTSITTTHESIVYPPPTRQNSVTTQMVLDDLVGGSTVLDAAVTESMPQFAPSGTSSFVFPC